MNKVQLEKQLHMLVKDLNSADKRCRKISKAIGLEDNHLISWARKEAESVLLYIESLKGGGNVSEPKNQVEL